MVLRGESHVKIVNFKSIPSANAPTLFLPPVLLPVPLRRSSDAKIVTHCLISFFEIFFFSQCLKQPWQVV